MSHGRQEEAADAVRLHSKGAPSGIGSEIRRLKVNMNANGLKEDATAAIRACVLITRDHLFEYDAKYLRKCETGSVCFTH